MDDEPDEDRMEARRRHNRLMTELDRQIKEQHETRNVEPPAPEIPPVHPLSARVVHRYGQRAEDEWCNRMTAKYGGQW